ncbi:MAG: tetratricopeptide repeat protein [Hyphomicrobium sp.]|nr:tetratricopeptide repeat protein [Hyphomicrobium sp.]
MSRWQTLTLAIAILLMLATAVVSDIVLAEPATDRLLQGVQVFNQKSCTAISISFNVRVRYVSHFPASTGRELRISVRPIDPAEASREVLTRRESLRVPETRFGRLRAIDFEVLSSAGPVLTLLFDEPARYRVSQGDDFQSIVVELLGSKGGGKCSKNFVRNGTAGGWAATVSPSVTTPSDAAPPALASARRSISGTASDEQNRNAAAWLDEGRAALKKEKFKEAVEKFSNILRLPETPSSADAQEYLGLAHQRSKNLAAARAEYQDYLVRYPTGESADRVRQRLAGIETAVGETSVPKLKTARSSEQRGNDGAQTWTLSGSVSQFYVRDDSFRTLRDPSLPRSVNEDLDLHDVHQNELLTSLDAIATWSGDGVKSKLRFSGTEEHEFDENGDDILGVAALFLNTSVRDWGTELRIGRQTRNTGGVLGRFDGALLSYDAAPAVRLNGVVGSPVYRRRDAPFEDERLFYGASVDFGIADGLDATLFAIEQRDRDILDRQAVGAEVRYNDSVKSVFANLDYDVHYNALNAAVLTGTWNFADKSNIHGAFDYRKSPYLSTWTAIQGDIYPSLYDMLRSRTLAEVEDLAFDRTASFTSGSAGFSHPISEKFQVNVDATVTNYSGTEASGGLPATEGTGNEYFLAAQIIGNGVFAPDDLFIAGLRYADLDRSDLYILDLSARYPLMENLKVNPRLMLGYRTGDNTDLVEFSVLPSVLFDYYLTRDWSLEFEVGARWTSTEEASIEETATDVFFTVGYRYDFYADGSAAAASRTTPYGAGAVR